MGRCSKGGKDDGVDEAREVVLTGGETGMVIFAGPGGPLGATLR
jgi:hypothetical protein